jgi:hypothetical protein
LEAAVLHMTSRRAKPDRVPLLASFTTYLSRNAWSVIRQICDSVHLALWALLVAGTVFLLLHIPQMRDARTIAEAQQALEISQENNLYCEKWGMRAGTHEHTICTMDLDAIRAKIEQRIADDSNF